MGLIINKESECKCCAPNINCAARRSRIKNPNILHCMCCPLQYKNAAYFTKIKEQNELENKKKENALKKLKVCDWDNSDIPKFYKDLSNNYVYYNQKENKFNILTEDNLVYLNYTPEGREKRNGIVNKIQQTFLISKGLSLITINNKNFYFNKETNELYEDIQYSMKLEEVININELSADRYFKRILGKKKQLFLTDYQQYQH